MLRCSGLPTSDGAIDGGLQDVLVQEIIDGPEDSRVKDILAQSGGIRADVVPPASTRLARIEVDFPALPPAAMHSRLSAHWASTDRARCKAGQEVPGIPIHRARPTQERPAFTPRVGGRVMLKPLTHPFPELGWDDVQLRRGLPNPLRRRPRLLILDAPRVSLLGSVPHDFATVERIVEHLADG